MIPLGQMCKGIMLPFDRKVRYSVDISNFNRKKDNSIKQIFYDGEFKDAQNVIKRVCLMTLPGSSHIIKANYFPFVAENA